MSSPDINAHIQQTSKHLTELTKPPDLENVTNIPNESKYFSMNVCKGHKISICKPLIPLKLTLFIYYGAGSFMTSFLTIIYKQRGVSLSELSLMTIVAPAFQFMGTTLSGITADKLGRAKPVLVANLLLYLSIVISIILMPKINYAINNHQVVNLTCHPKNEVVAAISCGKIDNIISVQDCNGSCSEEYVEQCAEEYDDCQILPQYNVSLSIQINNSYFEKNGSVCEYYVKSIYYANSTYSWCVRKQDRHCIVSCNLSSKVDSMSSTLFFAYVALYVLFLTTYSNCYRCLDVTCMFLVKEHDSSFGHERFFAMLGNVLMSPIAGYIADVATPEGSERNYTAAFYLAIGLNIFLLLIIYKLPVKVNPPGEKMWRKSMTLLKNLDIVVFLIIIFVLGTAWNFGKFFTFWYLEEMNASTILVGLITSVGALYSLPFLLTAHWWVKTVGSTRIFLLALLGYVLNCSGYSFLNDPWYSLILEGTGILSYCLLWVAVIEYSHDIAPEGLRASVIATSGAIHFSVGKATAGLMGQFIMNNFGGRTAFRIMAIICLIAAFFYVLYLAIRRNCYKTKDIFNIEGKSDKEWHPQEIYTVKS